LQGLFILLMDDLYDIELPVNIKPDDFENVKYPNPDTKRGWTKLKKDKLTYLLSTLYTKRNRQPGSWVHLSSHILQSSVISVYHYRKYLDWLIENDYIEQETRTVVKYNPDTTKLDKHYYRLKDQYHVPVSDTYQLGEKQSKILLDKIEDNKFRFSLDEEPYKSIVETFNRCISIDELSAKVVAQDVAEDELQFDMIDTKIDKIKNGDHNHTASKNTFRLYNRLTTLKRECRKYIRINGKVPVEIDISNSQPFLLINLWKNDIDVERLVDLGLNPKEQDVSELISKKDTNTFLSEITEAERELYMRSMSGEFYETLQEHLLIETRDEAKQFYMTLYDDNRKVYGKHAMFKNVYPNLSEYIYNSKKLNYSFLNNALQRLEAILFLYKIAPELMFNKNIDFVTVHDAVVVEPQHAETAQQVIESVYQQVLGTVPTTHTNKYEMNFMKDKKTNRERIDALEKELKEFKSETNVNISRLDGMFRNMTENVAEQLPKEMYDYWIENYAFLN